MNWNNILVVCTAWMLISCAESSIVGDEFVGDSYIDVSYIDTISLRMKTFRYDSMVTSSSDRLLLGHQSDSVFTSVHADGYFLVSIPSSNLVTEDYVFDSITMILPQDGYSDNIDEIFHANLILEKLSVELDFEDDTYYNFSEPAGINSEKTTLFNEQVKFYFDRDRDLEARIDDDFGQTLFDEFLEETDHVESSSEFHQYIKGFKLSLNLDTTAAIGFTADSIRFRMYFSENTATSNEQETMDLMVSGSSYYTHFTYNVPENLSSIEEYGDVVSSTKTNHFSILHGGLGYGVVISLPTIRELVLAGKDYLISGALLKIHPVDSYEDLPETINISYVDEDMSVVSSSEVSVSLVYDELYGRDTYYAMDIGDLVAYLMEDITNEEYSILISLDSDLDNSMTNLWLGDEVYNSELILYTITND